MPNREIYSKTKQTVVKFSCDDKYIYYLFRQNFFGLIGQDKTTIFPILFEKALVDLNYDSVKRFIKT